mmetsp:Transcript_31100/g.71065  ORF Transcript_31100/g.71065 Transcript_31100/m.71065 type:complete len:190 (+) Transcript_31100:156-725(+)
MPGTNSAWDTITKPQPRAILGSDEWPALTSITKAKVDGYSSDNSTNYESEAEGTSTQTSPLEQTRTPAQPASDIGDGFSDGADTDIDTLQIHDAFPSVTSTAEAAAEGAFAGCLQAQNSVALCAAAATHSAPPGLRLPLRSTAQAFVPRVGTSSASAMDFMAPPPGLRKPLRAEASAFVPVTPAVAAEG